MDAGAFKRKWQEAKSKPSINNTDSAKLLMLSSLLFQADRLSKEERHILKELTIRKDSSLVSVLRAFELTNEDVDELEENCRLLCAEYDRRGPEDYFAYGDNNNTNYSSGGFSYVETTPTAVHGVMNSTTASSAVNSLGPFSMAPRKKVTVTSAVPSFSSTGPAFNPGGNGDGTGGAGEGMLAYLMEPGWKNLLAPEFRKPYFHEIARFVENERRSHDIFPPDAEVFNAFNYTPLDQVKVVILGQDPYFNPGQAHGLCFSVRKGVPVPPSLVTIYKELERSVPGFRRPSHGCLEEWAHQGVLLLNATLTVRHKEPNSHAKCGWQDFTDAVIKFLNTEKQGIIYLLWGGFAQKKGKIVDRNRHIVLEAPHPSPMAAGGAKKFEGCGHFAQVNEILENDGRKPINWHITN